MPRVLCQFALIAALSTLTTPTALAAPEPARDFEVEVFRDAVTFSSSHVEAAFLRLEIFDAARDRVHDSGPVEGLALEWDLGSESGEPAAPGTYFYVVQAWDEDGRVVTSQVGKVAVAPEEMDEGELDAQGLAEGELSMPLKFDAPGDFTVFGRLGVGTEEPERSVHLRGRNAVFRMDRDVNSAAFLLVRTERGDFNDVWKTFSVGASASGPNDGFFLINDLGTATSGGGQRRVTIDNEGQFGINTAVPEAALEVDGASGTDLLLLKESGTPRFRVEADGDVFADGSYNCGLAQGCFNAGQGADVAERIDSVEQLAAGDVVEIDPDRPVRFRKSRGALSRRVAGVVSTAPAVTLGNDYDAESETWRDVRPLLALAGRVPVKVTVDPGGPIEVGDLLVSSPVPGRAMRCGEPADCIGAVIGKALESLAAGEGTIQAQVMLR